ncbi:RNA binding S1 domain protein [Aphanothece sacrum FPU1]|uniref:RNA binding S1 domain protein n=2 Tax=Aphanothece sacrum TaxID=1122 RepID=A0A401IMK8_APHSA|nr:RNA binding S1 domain protein [Aphanothece sacrum FPU1]GBF84366.1 RNA binding S1 domain protein [Aphanothece sacrum FPU3]
MDDFAQALNKHDYNFEKGQVIRGKIVQHTSDGAYVDIGGKSTGFVPVTEATLKSVTNLADVLPVNEEFDFLITSDQNAEGQVNLSRRQLQLQKAWENIAEMSESGQSVQMRVTAINKGGVIGEVEGLRGFIPRSHLVERDDVDSLVGQLLTATFLEVNQENKKLVLSQKRARMASEMGKLTPGTLIAGKVAKIQPYGVFIDLNGVTGLLHITQVSGVRIDALTTVFKIGQEIQVMILTLDEFKGRISLSTKILESYPGEILEKFDEMMATASARVEQAREKMEKEVE